MRKALISLLATTSLFLLSRLTPVAYGAGPGDAAPAGVRIEAAGRAAAPQATFYGGAHGGITPGDLFYIDAAGGPPGLTLSLYITNADALRHYLRYLILKIALCTAAGDSQWQPVAGGHGPVAENSVYLTLQNSPVRFAIGGGALYKIGIESGSYYCLPAGAGRTCEPPQFYLAPETG